MSFGGVLIDYSKKVLQEASQKRNFEACFINAREKLCKICEDDVERDKAYNWLCDTNLLMVVQIAEDKPGSEVISSVRKFIRDLADDEIRQKNFPEKFLVLLKKEIARKDKNLYEHISWAEVTEWQKQQLIEIHDKLDGILGRAMTMGEVEESFFINTGLDLDFFDYGEPEEENKLLDYILDEEPSLIVRASAKMEALYFLLRVLKTYSKYRVLIVDKQEKWNYLEGKIEGFILIPLFHAEYISVVEGNKVIFVQGKNEFKGNGECYEVPSRIIANLREKLRDKNISEEEITKIVSTSHGVFMPMMRLLSKGKYAEPKWIELKNFDRLVPAFLFNCWTDSEMDIGMIEELSGEKWEDYRTFLLDYERIDEPFSITQRHYGITIKKVVNPFDSWQVVRNYVSDKDLEKFRKILFKVILDDQEIAQVFEHTFSNSGNYSEQLKHGLLVTLIVFVLSNNEGDDKWKNFAEKLIADVLSKIITDKEWCYIIRYLPEMVEIAPNEVLRKIREVVSDEQSSFWKVFEGEQHNIFDKNFYTHVLFALEKALFIDEFTRRESIEILERIYLRNLHYGLVNSPEDTLSRVFCAWFQEIDLDFRDKIQLVKNFAENHPDGAWELLKKIAPLSSTGGTYTFLDRPVYRLKSARLTNVLPRENVCETYREYYALLIKCAGNDIVKWGEIFRYGTFVFYVDEYEREKIYLKMQSILKNDEISDKDKYEFSSEIREFIYDVRYYQRTYYKEEFLNEIEQKVFQEIRYVNKAYEFLYAFPRCGDIKELHPSISYNRDITYEQRIEYDRIKREKILQQEIGDNKPLLMNLLEIIEGQFYGREICEFYAHDEYDQEICQCLYDFGKFEVLGDFISRLVSIKGGEFLRNLFDSEYNGTRYDDFRLQALKHTYVTEGLFEYAQAQGDVFLLDYLNRDMHLCLNSQNPDFGIKLVKECLRLSLLDKALELVEYNDFGVDVYLEILENLVQNSEYMRIVSSDKIHHLFTRIYECRDVSNSQRSKIIELEEFFTVIGLFGKYTLQPKFLINDLKNNPARSAEYLKDSCRKDNEPKRDLSDEEQKKVNYYSKILFSVEFCPCEIDGVIDTEKLLKWCDGFSQLLVANEQIRVRDVYLGKFLARYLVNNRPPCEAVCKAVEKYHNHDFDDAFFIEVLNSRGVHTVDAGKGESALAGLYNSYAQQFNIDYPDMARILKNVAEYYEIQAVEERERASHG